MKCTRNVVTEPDNFIFIPTGHFLGEISGLTGYWDGRRNENNAPIVTFPEGDDDDEGSYCDACDEFGMYVICVDDLCHSGSGCIHGDGEILCPYCKGRGKL